MGRGGAAAVAKDKTKSIKDLSIYRWLSSELFIFVLDFHPRFNVVFPPCCNVAVLAHVCAGDLSVRQLQRFPGKHACPYGRTYLILAGGGWRAAGRTPSGERGQDMCVEAA